MAYDIDVTYFRCRLALLARGLKSRYAELANRDFPTQTPAHIIQLIVDVLELAIVKIESADEKLLQVFYRLVSQYQYTLNYLDNAHKEQTPRGLIVVLEGLLARISPGATFYAAPQSEYNYGIATFTPCEHLSLAHFLTAEESANLPVMARSTVHLIMFPRAERDNILVHAVFGHEVGHLIASKYLREEASKPEFLSALQDAFANVLKERPVPDGLSSILALKYRASLQTAISNARYRAMEELISDYVGTLLFGPAALFASYEIFALDDLDSAPTGDSLYPPSRFRLRFILDTLRDEGFPQSVTLLSSSIGPEGENHYAAAASLFDLISNIADDKVDTAILSQDIVNMVAYEWVGRSLVTAKPLIKAMLPADLIYKAAEFAAEMAHLIERLSMNVPPNELNVFPDTSMPCWQSALNASWLFRLHGKKQTPDGVVPFSLADYETISRLCLLAIENIALQREYQGHMSV